MARKVNTKFVAVVAILAMGVGAAGFLAYRKFHKDPKVFIARGDALLKEGKDEEAASITRWRRCG